MSSTFIDEFRTLNDDEESIEAHRHWEEIDAVWKSAIKNREDDHTILKHATGVRTAKSHKDLLLDQVARNVGELAEASGILVDYTERTLGKATQIGDVEELSREWHDLRRQGVGGSSLSAAIGFHWKSRPGFPVWMDEEEMDEHWSTMAIEKSTPASEPEPITSGVLYRGHVWEPALLCYYAELKDKTVGVSKATWQGHRDIQVINVDGIILDENGEPEGIAECKTSSREWTWDLGVPVNYRAQVLWYLDATGLKYADVIVRFDSGKIDIHRINAGDTIDGTNRTDTVTGYLDRINDRWDTLQDMLNDPVSLWIDGNQKILNEMRQLSDVFDIEDEWVTSPEEIANDYQIVQVTTIAPYERMDDKYTIPIKVKTSLGDQHYISGVSPAYYATPSDYDPDQGVSMDRIDDMMGKSQWIIATDTDTYTFLTGLYGDDMIVHASALRRMVTLFPGMKDFATVEDTDEWFNDVIAEEGDH